jgi:predicted Zn-dependent protease
LLEASNPSGAEKLLDRYILGHPEEANAFILRAEVRLALGQSLEAAQDYAEAIQRASQASPALYREWALALIGAGEAQWSNARSVVDIGLDQFSQDVSLLALGTDIALAENRPERAAAYIERLPSALANLPGWQDRVSALQCLASSVAEDEARLCLAAARSELEAQASR